MSGPRGERAGPSAHRAAPASRRARPRERLRTRLTFQGKVLAGLAALVGLAGANTGANLLFLVLGILCGTLVVSAVASRRGLRNLEIDLALPPLVEAESPVTAHIGLRGGAVRSVVLEGVFFPAGGLLIPALVPGDSTPFTARAPARGRVESVRVDAVSRAPFHLAEHRTSRIVPLAVDVFPHLLPERSRGREVVTEGPRDTRRPGVGGSLRNIRAYAPGDDPRRMDWRASARTGTLQVRDFHAEERARLVVVLETHAEPGPGFEAAASAAASAVRDALVDGYAVELRLGPDTLDLVSERDLERALRALARVVAEPGVAAGAAPSRAGRVLVFAGAPGSGTAVATRVP